MTPNMLLYPRTKPKTLLSRKQVRTDGVGWGGLGGEDGTRRYDSHSGGPWRACPVHKEFFLFFSRPMASTTICLTWLRPFWCLNDIYARPARMLRTRPPPMEIAIQAEKLRYGPTMNNRLFDKNGYQTPNLSASSFGYLWSGTENALIL